MKSYNRPIKNKIRRQLQSIILNHFGKEKKTMLTLETDEFLFTNLFKRSWKIFTPQLNCHVFKRMLINRNFNTNVLKGNINDYIDMFRNINVVYLDYCGLYRKNRRSLLKALNETVADGGIFGATFSLRQPFKECNDYEQEAITILRDVISNTNKKLKLKFSEIYKDVGGRLPMFTFLYEVGK